MFGRILTLIFSFICLAAGLSLILWVGLPERADYTALGLAPNQLPIAPEIGAVAPPLALRQLNGDLLQLSATRMSDTRGSTIILNFWATWCEPCKVEMPELQRLSDEVEGLRVIGINVGESPEAVRGWVEAFGLTFDIVLDPDGVATVLYRILGQPSTFVIAPDGTITHIFYGPVDFGTLRDAITPAPPAGYRQAAPP